jgi:hypothetical protein
MKTIKQHLKVVALFLSALILLQGCTVYHSANVTLEEAVRSDINVRIKTNDQQTLKFRKVGVENGNFYGVKKNNGMIVRTPLDHKFINSINSKDKTLSTILSIGIPVIIVGVLLAIAESGAWSSKSVKVL